MISPGFHGNFAVRLQPDTVTLLARDNHLITRLARDFVGRISDFVHLRKKTVSQAFLPDLSKGRTCVVSALPLGLS